MIYAHEKRQNEVFEICQAKFENMLRSGMTAVASLAHINKDFVVKGCIGDSLQDQIYWMRRVNEISCRVSCGSLSQSEKISMLEGAAK